MPKIRVSTENLRSNADKIFNSASELQNICRAVQNAANSAPSYNGQFGPKVQVIGRTMNAIGMQQSNELQANAADLKNRADKFEKTDRKSVIGNLYKWFVNIFRDNSFLQNFFGNLFKPTITASQSVSSILSTVIPSHQIQEERGEQIVALRKGGKRHITKEKIKEKKLERIKKKAREQDIDTSEWKDSWFEKWARCGYPPKGSDAYLAFLGSCYTSINHPVAIFKNGDEYFVYIRGTDGDLMKWDKSGYENNWYNTIAAFEGLQTGYEKQVLDLIRESNIPHNAKIHLIGHSQGGIIANNLVADLSGYNVASVTTFGAPPPINFELPKSVKTRYYGDKDDYVCKLTNYVLGALAVKYPEKADHYEKIRQEKNKQLTIIDSSRKHAFDMPNYYGFGSNFESVTIGDLANASVNFVNIINNGHNLENYISSNKCKKYNFFSDSTTKNSDFECIALSNNKKYDPDTIPAKDQTLNVSVNYLKVEEIYGFRSDDAILNMLCSKIESALDL